MHSDGPFASQIQRVPKKVPVLDKNNAGQI